MKSRHKKKRMARESRRSRVRKKVRGTPDRPRLCVYRSNGHMYAQIIDDIAGRTLASASSLRLEIPDHGEEAEAEGKKGKKKPEGIKTRRARAVGTKIAEAALEKGVTRVVFDRSGFLYHGRVAALAESARKGGLDF